MSALGQKQTCAAQKGMSALPPIATLIARLGMYALGHKRTSPWQQLVRETLHAAGHRRLDTGEITSGQAWLGCDDLGPNNEERRDHDKDNGQFLAHWQPLSPLGWIATSKQ